MAKKKSSYSEVKQMQDLSMDELEARFNAIAQRAEANSPSQRTGASGSLRKPQESPSSFANLNLGSEVDDGSDFETLSTEELAQKYLEPSTLEMRPEYADGSAPEKAIHKAIDGAAWARTKLAFTNKSVADQIKYLEGDFGPGNVKLSKGKNITVKDPKTNAWYQLDPEGAGEGDFIDKALEKTRDILADNADLAVSLGLGIATAGAAAPLAAGLTGLGAVAGAAGVGAASGAGSSMGKVLMGRLVGTYDSTPETMLKDIGLEMLLGAAGNSFIPGMKYGSREIGNMLKGTGKALKVVPEQSKQTLINLIGATSGQGPEMAEHVIKNSEKVGDMMTKYGNRPADAYRAALADTEDIANNIVKAKRALFNDSYGNFAKEAGEAFNPNIGRTFTGAADDQGYSLLKNNVLKWDPTSLKLTLNSADDIMKANPIESSVFADKKAQAALKPFVDVVNRFNTVGTFNGEAGGKQFLAFKRALGAATEQARVISEEKGLQSAYGEVLQFKNELLSNYLNRSLDPLKKDPAKYAEMMTKLISIDKKYKSVSDSVAPFVDALKARNKGNKDAFVNLYNKVFKDTKVTMKGTAAKDNIVGIINELGTYAPTLVDKIDDIGARKAAMAFSPWTRGGLDTAFSIGAAASGSPEGLAMLTARSPKINYHAAKLASSMYDGLDFVRKLSPAAKTQLLRTPEALQSFVKTITSIPGLEAQIGQQLGQSLQGSQNGQ